MHLSPRNHIQFVNRQAMTSVGNHHQQQDPTSLQHAEHQAQLLQQTVQLVTAQQGPHSGGDRATMIAVQPERSLIAVQQDRNPTLQQAYNCIQCSKVFARKEDHSRHMKLFHGADHATQAQIETSLHQQVLATAAAAAAHHPSQHLTIAAAGSHHSQHHVAAFNHPIQHAVASQHAVAAQLEHQKLIQGVQQSASGVGAHRLHQLTNHPISNAINFLIDRERIMTSQQYMDAANKQYNNINHQQ